MTNVIQPVQVIALAGWLNCQQQAVIDALICNWRRCALMLKRNGCVYIYIETVQNFTCNLLMAVDRC